MTEQARAIKSADELTLMRWTIRVCEAGMAAHLKGFDDQVRAAVSARLAG